MLHSNIALAILLYCYIAILQFHLGFKPGTSGTSLNCTTMYMVSGHHSNTFSLISPNQRHQSKFYKVINFSHPTCSYKNFPLNWSVVPGTFFLLSV